MNAPQMIKTPAPEGQTPPMATPPVRPKKKKKLSLAFHQFSRAAHAYLSAFAFLALIFFSVSGLLLNHPEWLRGNAATTPIEAITLPADDLAQALAAADREQAIANLLVAHLPLRGSYDSGEYFDDEAYIHFSGMMGSSDITLDLESGIAEFEVKRLGLTEIMHNLHRGKKASTAWSLVIDISAILITVLSFFGFFLFLLMRWRRRANLGLIGASLVILGAVIASIA